MNAVTMGHVAVRRITGIALLALILLNATELQAGTSKPGDEISSALRAFSGPSARTVSHEVVDAEAPAESGEPGDEPNASGMTISGIGVFDYADQVFMTIDA